MISLDIFRALANESRLYILNWLKTPTELFPPQKDGDLIRDGVCADFIRQRLGVSAATASRHLTILTDAELLIATRRKGWTFYRRNEDTIQAFRQQLETEL